MINPNSLTAFDIPTVLLSKYETHHNTELTGRHRLHTLTFLAQTHSNYPDTAPTYTYTPTEYGPLSTDLITDTTTAIDTNTISRTEYTNDHNNTYYTYHTTPNFNTPQLPHKLTTLLDDLIELHSQPIHRLLEYTANNHPQAFR